MIGLTIYDLILYPIYFIAIFHIFKKIRSKYANNKQLYLYFTWGFRVKMFIIIVYTLLSHFIIRGDAVDLYFGEGKHFTELIKNDLSKINLLFISAGKETDALASDDEKGYLAIENNYMVVKVCIILCMVGFSCFAVVNLIIGFIAFLGSWQLYLFFLRQYPKPHKMMAFACMGIPTVLFWSAGISKDTICITCLALITKCMYDITTGNKNSIRNWFLVIASILLIYDIKPYIILSYLPFYLLFLINNKISSTKIPIIRYALKLSIPILFIGLVSYISIYSKDLFKQYSSDKLLDSISNSQSAFTALNKDGVYGSFFSLGEFDGSLTGAVSMVPKAIMATLFRPFIWETKNFIMLLSALESALLLFFTIQIFFKPKGIRVFFFTPFKNNLVFYCLAFTILFATFVGLTTLNFGSLIRYKIPCMPFFVCGLVIINYIRAEKVKSSVMST